MLPIIEKVCLICEKPFQTRILRKKYCDNCQFVSIRISQIAKKRGVDFEEAKQILKRRRLKKCLDCGKNPVTRWGVRCSKCTGMKRLESYRRWERKQKMRFKCAKCGKPTTFLKIRHKISQLCEKHRNVKDRLRRRLMYWHQRDLKNKGVLQ